MYISTDNDRIHQGDVIKNLVFVDNYNSGIGIPLITPFGFSVVLTQDCDLEQEIIAIEEIRKSNEPGFVLEKGKKPPTNDKYLKTILVCPAFIADTVRSGEHLSQLGLKMQAFNSDLWNPIPQNNNSRYHYLKESKEDGLPALVLDFKHFYTLPRDYAYSMISNKQATLKDMFAQSVSHRFAYYISRVALPEPTNPKN